MKNIQHKELPSQIFNLKGWINLVDENQLKEVFTYVLEQSGFTILNYSSHQFPINGFTAFWLLAESHLALHTFTESGWCYIELSSCNFEKTNKFRTLTEKQKSIVKWDVDIQKSEPFLKQTIT